MGLHRLTSRLVQNQIGKIEFDDAVQPRCKITKKLIQVSLRSDRLRNVEKRLVLALEQIPLLPLYGLIVHASRIYTG